MNQAEALKRFNESLPGGIEGMVWAGAVVVLFLAVLLVAYKLMFSSDRR